MLLYHLKLYDFSAEICLKLYGFLAEICFKTDELMLFFLFIFSVVHPKIKFRSLYTHNLSVEQIKQ